MRRTRTRRRSRRCSWWTAGRGCSRPAAPTPTTRRAGPTRSCTGTCASRTWSLSTQDTPAGCARSPAARTGAPSSRRPTTGPSASGTSCRPRSASRAPPCAPRPPSCCAPRRWPGCASRTRRGAIGSAASRSRTAGSSRAATTGCSAGGIARRALSRPPTPATATSSPPWPPHPLWPAAARALCSPAQTIVLFCSGPSRGGRCSHASSAAPPSHLSRSRW